MRILEMEFRNQGMLPEKVLALENDVIMRTHIFSKIMIIRTVNTIAIECQVYHNHRANIELEHISTRPAEATFGNSRMTLNNATGWFAMEHAIMKGQLNKDVFAKYDLHPEKKKRWNASGSKLCGEESLSSNSYPDLEVLASTTDFHDKVYAGELIPADHPFISFLQELLKNSIEDGDAPIPTRSANVFSGTQSVGRFIAGNIKKQKQFDKTLYKVTEKKREQAIRMLTELNVEIDDLEIIQYVAESVKLNGDQVIKLQQELLIKRSAKLKKKVKNENSS
jgi:hypothetical protein